MVAQLLQTVLLNLAQLQSHIERERNYKLRLKERITKSMTQLIEKITTTPRETTSSTVGLFHLPPLHKRSPSIQLKLEIPAV
jgi:hypothetical protein